MGLTARIGAAVAATALAAVGALASLTGTAVAQDGSGHSEGHGAFALASFDWHLTRDSDGHVSGYFTATPTQPVNAVLALQGPVTCAVIEGNKVGFLYPIQDNSRPGLIKGQYVMITGEDNGGHGKDKIGAIGPAPKAAFPSCRPGLTPFAVTSGHVSVSSGSWGD